MKPPLNLKRPPGLVEFLIKKAASKHYAVFDNKTDSVYLTSINKTVRLSEFFPEGLKHNEKLLCLNYSTEIIAKEKRYGRKNITEFGRVLWFNKHNYDTYAQLDKYIIDYTGETASVYVWPSAQYKLSHQEQSYWKNEVDYFGKETWIKRKEVKIPSANQGQFGWQTPKFEKTIIYTPSLLSIGKDFKYAINFEKYESPYELIGYMNNFLKYRSIELLEKAGFEKLVLQRARGVGSKSINWRANDLKKILKLNGNELKQFKACGNISVNNLERYHAARKVIPGISFKQLELLPLNFDYCRNLPAELVGRNDLLLVVDYLARQNQRYKNYSNLKDYADYIEQCHMLNLDLKKRRVLRPKNFHEEHMRLSSVITENKDEIIKQAFIDNQNNLQEMKQPFFANGLFIRPATAPRELDIESDNLHHCVRTYKEKVANGKCNIFFIRKAETPDEPFYTLELNPQGVVVQCRGNCNCSMTEDVKRFVEEWIDKRNKKGQAA